MCIRDRAAGPQAEGDRTFLPPRAARRLDQRDGHAAGRFRDDRRRRAGGSPRGATGLPAPRGADGQARGALLRQPELARTDERCLLYTSDAADERSSVDLGGRRIIKKKKPQHIRV